MPDALATLPLTRRTCFLARRTFELLVVDPAREDDLLDEAWARGDARNPYFAHLWPSAKALAEELAERGRLDGVHAVELGAGVGAVGLVAATLGARVTLTDVLPDALALARENARRNRVEVEVAPFDLRSPPTAARYDLALASDLLYESWQPPALARALAAALHPDGVGLVADPHRASGDAFAAAAAAEDLEVVARRRVCGFARRTHAVRVFEVRRRRA